MHPECILNATAGPDWRHCVQVWYTVDVQPENQPWKYSVGFVNRQMIEAHLPKPAEKTMIFMCGPPPMLNFACKPNLEKAGHAAANVLYF